MVRHRASMHRRDDVVGKFITYVGLDVHKDTIAVCLAERLTWSAARGGSQLGEGQGASSSAVDPSQRRNTALHF